MVMRVFDSLCPEHGGLSHICVHEAAHAVAAVDRGIRFSHVEVPPLDQWVPAHDGYVAGAVHLHEPDPTAWVPHNPVAALEFLLAGAVAENGVFDHDLAGYGGDLTLWRRGMRLTGASSMTAVDEALGRPFSRVVKDTKTWVQQRYPAIRRVVTAIINNDPTVPTIVNADEFTALSEDDVRSLAAE